MRRRDRDLFDRDRERFRLDIDRDLDRDRRTRTNDLDLLRLRRTDRDLDLLFLVGDRDFERRLLLDVERDLRFHFGLDLWREEERALLLGLIDSRLALPEQLRLFLAGLGCDAPLLVLETDRDLERLPCFINFESSCFLLESATVSMSVLDSSSRWPLSCFGIISGSS